MNKRHYEHTLPNIRGSLSNTYFYSIRQNKIPQPSTKESRGILLSCVTIAQRSPDTLMKKTVYTFFIFPLLPHPRMSLRA